MPSAAVMISVDNIKPTTISVVCAFRRGILRTPSLKITGRRQAINATTARHSSSRPTITTMICTMGMPNNASMYVSSRLVEPGRDLDRRRLGDVIGLFSN